MKRTHATSLALLLCLGGCGEAAPPRQRATAPPPVTIMVLDPAGRLLDTGRAPELFRIDNGVAVRLRSGWQEDPLYTSDTLPSPDTELLVVAHGCKPKRMALVSGRNIVRLEAGFRVRVSIAGVPPTLPDKATLGMVLDRRVNTVAGIDLPVNVTLQALRADAFDTDAPTHPQYMSIPNSHTFDILVQTPGPYRLSWDIRTDKGASSTSNRRAPYVLEPDMGALHVIWATPSIEQMVKRMRRGR